jgi:hypothetical protein
VFAGRRRQCDRKANVGCRNWLGRNGPAEYSDYALREGLKPSTLLPRPDVVGRCGMWKLSSEDWLGPLDLSLLWCHGQNPGSVPVVATARLGATSRGLALLPLPTPSPFGGTILVGAAVSELVSKLMALVSKAGPCANPLVTPTLRALAES